MSSDLKPIKLHGKGGPNPPKVAMLLAELDLPHEIMPVSFPDLKMPEYLAINPNGRMPAITDPNNDDFVLWESGAIIEYLIERYDTKQKLSFAPGSKEAFLAKQWLYYQVSGQGPYFGQAVWFIKYHSEKLPSAVERYVKEANRVTAVLDGHLAKQKVVADGDGPWLVGGKLSFADLSFVPWTLIASGMYAAEGYDFDMEKYPNAKKWFANMMARPIVKNVMDEAFKQH